MKDFKNVYQTSECVRCGCTFEHWGHQNMCAGCLDEMANEDEETEDEHEFPSIEPCARCGLPTSSRDDIGEPLCNSCYVELTMTGDDE